MRLWRLTRRRFADLAGTGAERFGDPSQMQELQSPPGLNGRLWEYQKRGLSWLSYLESLGLNPCLADDMGLGKTIQVIALLLLESHFRDRRHGPVYYLHGGTNRGRRERMIAEFQDPATPPAVFVLSLKAGGVGITLTKANHVFHFDRWWNPAVENQATDRAFRIGQRKKVIAHKLVTLGTLEERIDQMLEDKQRLADSIVGQDEAWLTELDNDAFRELIQLNRATVMEA